jgi:hypothetical protein
MLSGNFTGIMDREKDDLMKCLRKAFSHSFAVIHIIHRGDMCLRDASWGENIYRFGLSKNHL